MYTRVPMFPCRECSWCRAGAGGRYHPPSPPLSRLLSDVTASLVIQREWERDRLGREKGKKWRGKTERVVGEIGLRETDRRAKMMAGRGSWEERDGGRVGEGEGKEVGRVRDGKSGREGVLCSV